MCGPWCKLKTSWEADTGAIDALSAGSISGCSVPWSLPAASASGESSPLLLPLLESVLPPVRSRGKTSPSVQHSSLICTLLATLSLRVFKLLFGMASVPEGGTGPCPASRADED